jgi:NADH:ubiquinone oxidoreductase subunit 2 (subunit N)
LAGFAAKFQILGALIDSGKAYGGGGKTALEYSMYFLVGALVVNTVLSAVYYIKVMKIMILDKTVEELEGRPSPPIPIPVGSAFYGTVLAGMIFVVGIAWDPLARASSAGTIHREVPRLPVAAARANGDGVP